VELSKLRVKASAKGSDIGREELGGGEGDVPLTMVAEAGAAVTANRNRNLPRAQGPVRAASVAPITHGMDESMDFSRLQSRSCCHRRDGWYVGCCCGRAATICVASVAGRRCATHRKRPPHNVSGA